MTNGRKTGRKRSSSRQSDGKLDSAWVKFRFPVADVRLPEMIKELSDLPGFAVRPDKESALGATSAGSLLDGGHTHLEVEKPPKAKTVILGLEFVPGPHGLGQGKTIELKKAILSVKRYLKKELPEQRVPVSGCLLFDSKRWEPTIPLPFSPMGLGGQPVGLASVCGLEFAFPDATESQPISRAFVSAYPDTEKVVVRLLLRCMARWDESMPTQIIELIEKQARVFVRERKT